MIWCPEAWGRDGSACREWNVASRRGGSSRKTSPADRWEGWRGGKSEGGVTDLGNGAESQAAVGARGAAAGEQGRVREAAE